MVWGNFYWGPDHLMNIKIILRNENNEITLCRGIMAQLLPGAPISLIDNIKKIISENHSILSNLGEGRNFKEILYNSLVH